MERLNLRQLEIFSAVVDAGSFTAAAEKLYLAQSTVSDNVRALEELLHLKLFPRESKRRLTLTLEGKRVYRYAQDILGRCSALLLDVAVDSALELTLGASTVPAQSLLPGYMARFARENPACRCTLLCGDSAAVQQMLLNGDIHLGFVGSADRRGPSGAHHAEHAALRGTENAGRARARAVPRAVPLPRARERHAEDHRQLSQRDPP